MRRRLNPGQPAFPPEQKCVVYPAHGDQRRVIRSFIRLVKGSHRVCELLRDTEADSSRGRVQYDRNHEHTYTEPKRPRGHPSAVVSASCPTHYWNGGWSIRYGSQSSGRLSLPTGRADTPLLLQRLQGQGRPYP